MIHTTETIRRLYSYATRWNSKPPEGREDLWALQDSLRAEFDEWLAETLRAEREKAWDEGHADYYKDPSSNPHRKSQET